jgi:glycosyltransferase involved in cell wall biosynthesis
MRVVQIVTQMEAAGAQKVAYLLHTGLARRGHDCHLLFLYMKRPAYDGLPGVSSLLDHPPKHYEYLEIVARLVARARELRPDAIITHTHYANVLGQAAALAAGVANRIAVHHNPLATYPRAARVVDAAFGYAHVYSKMIAVSDAVIGSLARYPRRYQRAVSRIYNGIPPLEDSPTTEVRATYGIPRDAPVLLNVGRMSRQKNHPTLLEAVSMIPGAHLVLVGDGELRDPVQRLAEDLHIADRVHMTGEIPFADVRALLHTASAFVFPSLWEAMPMAVVEAMQAGAAIVGSDIPALREVLGDAAVLVPAEDATKLAEAVKGLLADESVRTQLRERAIVRGRRFTADAMIDEYEALLT